jgi:recA bacterial DNA recombination protein
MVGSSVPSKTPRVSPARQGGDQRSGYVQPPDPALTGGAEGVEIGVRGALTEIAGPTSSGRTAFLNSLLAEATANNEFCALIDAEDVFDPAIAAAGGVLLSQVLWVRCGGNVEHALKAADMLAQSGGFGLVAIDLGDTPERTARRIPLAVWFRLRHGVRNTQTALVCLARQVNAHSCSTLEIELRRDRAIWRGGLLQALEIAARWIRNHREEHTRFQIPVR